MCLVFAKVEVTIGQFTLLLQCSQKSSTNIALPKALNLQDTKFDLHLTGLGFNIF